MSALYNPNGKIFKFAVVRNPFSSMGHSLMAYMAFLFVSGIKLDYPILGMFISFKVTTFNNPWSHITMVVFGINQNRNGLLSNLTFKFNHNILVSFLLAFQCYINMRGFFGHIFHYIHFLYIVRTPQISLVLLKKYKFVIFSTSPTLDWSTWLLFCHYFRSIASMILYVYF